MLACPILNTTCSKILIKGVPALMKGIFSCFLFKKIECIVSKVSYQY
jgi:hypothetical protein